MSQPTIEEIRAQLTWRGRYAAEPGTGPAGRTCRSCAFLKFMAGAGRYPKCGKTQYTHGDKTSIKTRTPACRLFEEDH